MAESEWRQRARQVIERVLSELPVGATFKEKRKALNAAYPFGERASHPYRMWLSEVRKATGTKSRPKDDGVAIRVHGITHEPYVSCGNCNGRDCLLCLPMRLLVEKRRASTDWNGWLDWLRILSQPHEGLAGLAFADWLEEQGWPEVAKQTRAKG